MPLKPTSRIWRLVNAATSSGDEAYLEPYNDALKHIHADLNHVRTLTADNPL